MMIRSASIGFFVACIFALPFYASAENARVEAIGDKRFLMLAQEAPPPNMTWKAFGEVIETYLGVSAISNGAATTDRRYQCTELIHRFLREMYGLPSRIGLGLGHGKDLARGVGTRFANPTRSNGIITDYVIHLEYFEGGKSRFPPVVGSIVSMYFNRAGTGYGHVGIIRTLDRNDDGSVSGLLFDQHGSMHNTVGIPIQSDTVIFNSDGNGYWSGQVLSWKYNRKYPVIGWSSVVVTD